MKFGFRGLAALAVFSAAGCDMANPTDPLAGRAGGPRPPGGTPPDASQMIADNQTRGLRKQLEEKDKELATLRDTIAQLEGELARKRETEGDADGEIKHVDFQLGTYLIDLGDGDQLVERNVLTVYAAGTGPLTPERKRADVMITKIIAPHLAEARVIQGTLKGEVSVGDKLKVLRGVIAPSTEKLLDPAPVDPKKISPFEKGLKPQP